MMKRLITMLAATILVASTAMAADVYENKRARWMRMAEETTPVLHHQVARPLREVKPVADNGAFQGWRYEPTAMDIDSLRTKNFKDIGELTLDFGRHLVGHFRFHTKTLGHRTQDAPIRIRFFFGELPAELNTTLDPWRGTLSRAWMQDEVVTVTQCDQWIEIPRRMAFRYLKISLLGASTDFDFAIDDMEFRAQSSADEVKTKLLPTCPADIAEINRVGIETLRECMQTVYEDGPKRDRRLWIGDMYLESLANRHSFRNFQMTKHCLYLFAALAADDGVLVSNCFEQPVPHAQHGSYCLTYCLLWNSALLEYLNDTDDRATAVDLWQVAKRQTDDALTYVDERGIFDQHRRGAYIWLFFDWRDGLDVNTPMQGATIFALQQTYRLAQMIGREKEVAHYPAIIRKMQKAARTWLYDRKSGVMVSGMDSQGCGMACRRPQWSILSQVWSIKAGILSAKEGARALRTAMGNSRTLMPGTPYATHYLIEAMLMCGMKKEARQQLADYWGGMVEKGADTFWEAYDPTDDFISPYGFSPVNSACHAWSCTPVYFIHQYPEVFQQ